MNTIALPKKISFTESDEKNRATVSLEPLAPGYGTTLGNALRRVLLSSLPGAAVVGAKIEGATHEFMALPNVKEDVLQIMLNLKNVRFILDEGVNEARLELKADGEKIVKASDIVKQAGVTVVNPDQPIAQLTDVGATFNMEIFVSRGLGYETIENRENRKAELGYIDIDSIFSPIMAVALTVENVRVGKMVNWDKMMLDITTDGTLTIEEAFGQAVDILSSQINGVRSLLNGEVPEEENASEEGEGEATQEMKETEEVEEPKGKSAKKSTEDSEVSEEKSE
ncbi:MAG: DNA-directed RNA polymerase subunit alpha [Patescibacteria group bacterium]|nr:MAG: DNA-directed RNA polymerase subunit alpha [Patescibacteria group bacterium]